jgi:acetyl esterase/lipase
MLSEAVSSAQRPSPRKPAPSKSKGRSIPTPRIKLGFMKPLSSSLLTILVATLLVATASPQTRTPSIPVAPPSPIAETSQENIVYGSVNGTGLHLDLYQPPDREPDPKDDRGNQLRPAVILIHGGGWVAFDKSTMHGMGEFLARSGFVAFAVDYRLFSGKQNLWPAQLDDVQRAVRWVRANASQYGVDPDRIGAFGHSAGAQLAALLGMEDTRDNSDRALAKYSSKVQAVVEVSGPTDFTTNHDADGDAFLTAFLGGDYTKHPELWRDASPVFHVAKNNAPFLIIHGTQDEDVPIAQAQELYDKLKAAKVPASFVKADDVHTFRTPEARRELAVRSLEFFNRYLVTAR